MSSFLSISRSITTFSFYTHIFTNISHFSFSLYKTTTKSTLPLLSYPPPAHDSTSKSAGQVFTGADLSRRGRRWPLRRLCALLYHGPHWGRRRRRQNLHPGSGLSAGQGTLHKLRHLATTLLGQGLFLFQYN